MNDTTGGLTVLDSLFSENVSFAIPGPEAKNSDTVFLSVAEALNIKESYRKVAAEVSGIKSPVFGFEVNDAEPKTPSFDSGVDSAFNQFLARFRKNVELLIEKTWVGKGDEDRKDELEKLLQDYVNHVKKTVNSRELKEFSEIIKEIAYLLFGEQSKKDDFFIYAERIDTPMGLFFRYGAKLPLLKVKDASLLRAALLLGMVYLTDF